MAAHEPSAHEIVKRLVEAGEVELERRPKDLAPSSFIAGLDIGFGPLAIAVVAGRLIVLASNTVGSVVFSLFAAHTSIVFAPYTPIYRAIGMPLVSHSFLPAVLAAIFYGIVKRDSAGNSRWVALRVPSAAPSTRRARASAVAAA